MKNHVLLQIIKQNQFKYPTHQNTQEEPKPLRSGVGGGGGGGGGAVEAAVAAGALLEVGDAERGRERPDVEAELVAAPVDLVDSDPQEEHLHADAVQVLDRARLHRPRDLLPVLQLVLPRDFELAVVLRKVDLERAVLPQQVARHARREDPRREVEPLEDLVRRRRAIDWSLAVAEGRED